MRALEMLWGILFRQEVALVFSGFKFGKTR